MGLMLVGILAHYTWIAVEVAEVRRLRVENLALAAKARAYEENAGQLQAKVLQLQSVVTKLGLMAGVEEQRAGRRRRAESAARRVPKPCRPRSTSPPP